MVLTLKHNGKIKRNTTKILKYKYDSRLKKNCKNINIVVG